MKSSREILALPQIEQQSEAWYAARRNKQSASDFGAVVPRDARYIQHIVDMWGSDDLRKKVTHCYTFGPDEYYLNKVHYPLPLHSEPTRGFTSKTCAIGHQFEPIVRIITQQHLGKSIVEMGWVQGQHTPHAGVSPDGLVIDDELRTVDEHEQCRPHWYSYNCAVGQIGAQKHINNVAGFARQGPKNFEAKTIISRAMTHQVPLKYHIQVERTAYELGVQGSIYTEAKFLGVHEETWREEVSKYQAPADGTPNIHLEYGIMLLKGWDSYQYAPEHIVTPAQFLDWVEAQRQTDQALKPIFFKVDAFWCVEIPLWDKYADVYGPLILTEAEKLHWFATTAEGKLEYNRLKEVKAEKKRTREAKQNCRKQQTFKPDDLMALFDSVALL